MSKNRSNKVTLSCIKCNQFFHPWKASRPSKYCSRACAPAGRQPKKPSTKCEKCGVLFIRYGGTQAARFCSRDCYRTSYSKVANGDGYIKIYAKDEPGAYKSGQIPEHRMVMQRHLNRRLERWETVHHINGDRADNRIENLQLMTGKHGKGIVMKCADCGSHNIISASISSGG